MRLYRLENTVFAVADDGAQQRSIQTSPLRSGGGGSILCWKIPAGKGVVRQRADIPLNAGVSVV